MYASPRSTLSASLYIVHFSPAHHHFLPDTIKNLGCCMARSFSAWIHINFPELTAAEVFRDILVNQKTYFRKMLLIHFSPVFLVKQIPQMHPQTDCLCHSLGCRAASSNTLPYPFLQWYLHNHASKPHRLFLQSPDSSMLLKSFLPSCIRSRQPEPSVLFEFLFENNIRPH